MDTNTEKQEKPTTQEPAASAKTDPGQQQAKQEPAKTEAAPKPKAEAQAAAAAAPVASQAPKKTTLGADDDIPEDAELIELSSTALKKRLDRHSKKELRERFGTDDWAAIKKDLDEVKSLREEKETKRKEQLSKEERLKEERDEAIRGREAAERQLRLTHEDRVVEKEDTRITKIAEKHIDPDYIDVLLPKLARHLMSEYSEEEMSKVKDKDIENWFKEQVKNKPKLAKDYGQTAEVVAKPKVPLNSGQENGPPSAGSNGVSTQKTFKPGQANSMGASEARSEAAKQGYRWT